MRRFPGLLCALFWVTSLGAQGWEGDRTMLPVPPTAPARQSTFSMGIAAKTPVELLKAQTVKDPSGVTISVRKVREGVGDALLWELRWEPGAPWGPGTWVAFRDGLGRLRELRIILLEASDDTDSRIAQPGSWIRLVPQTRGPGCRLDLFLAGRLVTGGWAVSASLLDVLGTADPWLWDYTEADLDWTGILPHRRWEDEKVELLRARIHKALSTVPEEKTTLWWPDPRSSRNGTAATGAPWGSWTGFPGDSHTAQRGLGPWGVTLWVATGVLRGWGGSFPDWDTLMAPTLELPGYSRALPAPSWTENPAFALDWIRNLGLSVQRVLYPSRPRTVDAADLRGLPHVEPVEGAGYLVDDFPALIHLMAVSRPGQVYLVSLSVQQVDKGTSSAVSFREPAVVLPWIGSDNRVRVVVYAGPREQTWNEWKTQVSSGRAGARPDHLSVTVLPLPAQVELPLLPAR